jgi:hypothetical protein
MFMKIITGTAVFVLTLAAPHAGLAQVYSNNFQTAGSESNSLTASANMGSLTRFSRPTDGGGLGSASQSMWLGALGYGVAKSGGTPETVTLSLSGLTAGNQYKVAFDLLIGGSWDGSANGYGPDRWSFTAQGSATSNTLVNATFSNCGVSNELCGASSPQSYSDATPLGGATGPTFAPETGADFFYDAAYDYSQDYGIYWFGHGAGNPMLSFVADGSTASLLFQRWPTDSGDSPDEYWGLDNIVVTGDVSAVVTPEPSAIVLLATGLMGVVGWSRRRRV